MSFLKKLLLGTAILALVLVVVGFLLPKSAHVEREVLINAPPATVFTLLNGFRQFKHWSPWQDADPNMQMTFAGPPMGVGAKLSWAGNSAVGTGSQEILESEPFRRILVRLEFGDFGGDFKASYAISPEGDGTRMVWSFDADYGSSVIGRYLGLISDSMLGPDYEKGLAKLKALAESLPKDDFSGLEISSAVVEAEPFVFVSGRSVAESRALGVALGVAYGKVSGYLSNLGINSDRAPIALFHGKQEGLLFFDAGYPVDRADVPEAGEIRFGKTPSGSVIRAIYRGSSDGLVGAQAQLLAYLATAGLERDGPVWERYPDTPGTVPNPVTELYAAVK